MFKNIIFDLYGTLVDIRTDEQKPEFWQAFSGVLQQEGLSYNPVELQKRYLSLVQKALARITHSPYPDTRVYLVLETLFHQHSVSVTPEKLLWITQQFRKLSTEYIRLYQGIPEMLQKLKEHGLKLYILSNGQREFSEGELRELGIYEYFDGFYFSADYEMSKPDPQFYRVLLEREHITPSECLMVGNDHTTDIAGANAIGMASVYIQSNHSHEVSLESVPSTYKVAQTQNQGRALESILLK
ncbi:HAD family hydrolase [Gracilinema caldarium]|uniref:HAD-superfamily hydrolase, subfamily IA, variant 3 n=1 Tax=Gracilinema caldarium (strain ATCC 51460 / DSM 7334 / H1) TaxID=744872 RepID=F8EYE1_GRAC1|nr:HAD family hydrolase [Gracilinema caldarium]AEJ18373.1 HAD-superfamily hydrolase, subfamily IA, variant 3 [Gracilinema caldarium DSM 7334]